MTPELIIFDFDGTLADTTATILQTYRMAIKVAGAAPRSDAECQATIGVPLRQGFRQLYPDCTDSELDTYVKTYRHIFYANKKDLIPQLYPGVKETLEKLACMGIEMSIASSRSRDSLIEFCEATGIDGFFSLILGADDVVHPKPDPEPVLVTLKRLGRDASRSIMVGDMPVDIAMGLGAGCMTVGVTYGNSTRHDLAAAGASRIIDSMPELTDIVKSPDK